MFKEDCCTWVLRRSCGHGYAVWATLHIHQSCNNHTYQIILGILHMLTAKWGKHSKWRLSPYNTSSCCLQYTCFKKLHTSVGEVLLFCIVCLAICPSKSAGMYWTATRKALLYSTSSICFLMQGVQWRRYLAQKCLLPPDLHYYGHEQSDLQAAKHHYAQDSMKTIVTETTQIHTRTDGAASQCIRTPEMYVPAVQCLRADDMEGRVFTKAHQSQKSVDPLLQHSDTWYNEESFAGTQCPERKTWGVWYVTKDVYKRPISHIWWFLAGKRSNMLKYNKRSIPQGQWCDKY